jgi:septation ring formation regulator EzrA
MVEGYMTSTSNDMSEVNTTMGAITDKTMGTLKDMSGRVADVAKAAEQNLESIDKQVASHLDSLKPLREELERDAKKNLKDIDAQINQRKQKIDGIMLMLRNGAAGVVQRLENFDQKAKAWVPAFQSAISNEIMRYQSIALNG